MLAIPAFQVRTQIALIRANNKSPLEVVAANLVNDVGFDIKNSQIIRGKLFYGKYYKCYRKFPFQLFK